MNKNYSFEPPRLITEADVKMEWFNSARTIAEIESFMTTVNSMITQLEDGIMALRHDKSFNEDLIAKDERYVIKMMMDRRRTLVELRERSRRLQFVDASQPQQAPIMQINPSARRKGLTELRRMGYNLTNEFWDEVCDDMTKLMH